MFARPFMMFHVYLITALGLWLDCVSCAFVACVCFSFIVMHQVSTTSSNVGLAISQSLILTGMVQYGIRQMMESFQLFTNTERVLQYTKLEQEPLISRKPTRDWPFKGTREVAAEPAKSLNQMSFQD
jgi:ATP-binding cassette, subfamily C (CFTR/MRP), member 4